MYSQLYCDYCKNHYDDYDDDMHSDELCNKCYKEMEDFRLKEMYGSFKKLVKKYEKLNEDLKRNGIIIENDKVVSINDRYV